MTAERLEAIFPRDHYTIRGPVVVEPKGEKIPVIEADVVVTDNRHDDRVVLVGDIRLPMHRSLVKQAARDARHYLAGIRNTLLQYRDTILSFRDPADRFKVKGVLRPEDPLPALSSFGPMNAAAGLFDYKMPVVADEDEILFRALYHRYHPEDVAAIAGSEKLQHQFAILEASDDSIAMVGMVLEVLVRHEISADEFPEPEFWVTGGLTYQMGSEGNLLGELDILIIRREDRKIILIGEAKLSKGDSFAFAIEKAQKQLKRIRDTISGPDSDKLVFVYTPDPCEEFSLANFQDVDTEYRAFGSQGACAYGFDQEIDLERAHGDLLYREIHFAEKDGLELIDFLSRSKHRKLSAMRERLVKQKTEEDIESGITYGENDASIEKHYAKALKKLLACEDIYKGLRKLVRCGYPWHEMADIFRGHSKALSLIRSGEEAKVSTQLIRFDCPPEPAAAILATF